MAGRKSRITSKREKMKEFIETIFAKKLQELAKVEKCKIEISKLDSLIGTDRLYYDLKNGDGWYVYVEKQGIYQRRENGKRRRSIKKEIRRRNHEL
jgi:hypothetical protein